MLSWSAILLPPCGRSQGGGNIERGFPRSCAVIGVAPKEPAARRDRVPVRGTSRLEPASRVGTGEDIEDEHAGNTPLGPTHPGTGLHHRGPAPNIRRSNVPEPMTSAPIY